jgi:oligopeptide transport system substrate-binding protein
MKTGPDLSMLLCGFAALLMVSCGGQAVDDTTTLHRGNRIEPLSLDPHVAIIMDERTIVADLFVGLYEPGQDGRPILGLAQSVNVSDDGLTWTFQLRDALWSDGVPITATDVVAGLRRTVNPTTRNQYPSPIYMIENAEAVSLGQEPVDSLGVHAVDTMTVQLLLEYPAPYLPSVLMNWGQPVPEHSVTEFGDSWTRPEHIVTSGPFSLTEWRSNNFIHLAANPLFYDADRVCLTDVYYYPTIDTSAAERRVRSGELDLNREFASSSLGFLMEHHPALIQMGPGLTIRDVTFNVTSPPFDNSDIRQALSMAIDRRFIADDVFGGADTAMWRPIPEGISGRSQTVALRYADLPMDERRATARAMLEAAGYGPDNPLIFTFYYVPSAGWPRIAPVLQADWALIAPWVEVTVSVRDTQLHYDAMRAGDFQAAASGWVADFDDPYAYLLQWESRAGEVNYSRWSNPEYDRLVADALVTVDATARADLFGRAEQLVLDFAPMTPVFVQNNKPLVGERVEGWITNPGAINQSRWLCLNGEHVAD